VLRWQIDAYPAEGSSAFTWQEIREIATIVAVILIVDVVSANAEGRLRSAPHPVSTAPPSSVTNSLINLINEPLIQLDYQGTNHNLINNRLLIRILID